MFFTFLKYWLLSSLPKPVSFDLIYIPEDMIEYVVWLISQIDTKSLHELNHKDYGLSMALNVSDFDELFYYIDIATRFSIKELDTKDVSYPWQDYIRTLIELRYGSKREYSSFSGVVDVLLNKCITLIRAIHDSEEVDQYYLKRRWKNLFLDIIEILEMLIHRQSI